jgi:flagellar assembly factor FliW
VPITVESSRFGPIEIDEEAVIDFPDGLVGLPGRRWALLARDEGSDFLWLHSIEEPSVALPVTNPWLFFADYAVEIGSAEAERMGIGEPADADVYVTVRAAPALEDFRANLRAPILITGGRGFQVLNEVPGTPVRAPMFQMLVDEIEIPVETIVG